MYCPQVGDGQDRAPFLGNDRQPFDLGADTTFVLRAKQDFLALDEDCL